MSNITKIKTWVENESCRSHWERAVRDYALWIISKCNKKDITSYKELLDHCNAKNMDDYAIAKALSEGGCFEICDADIAKRLCTPSEFKRYTHKDGTISDRPNRNETWIDVQTRAVYQAILLLERACFWYC